MKMMLFSQELMVWEFFAIIGLILVLAEIFVSGFILFPIGLACFVTALTAVYVDSWIVVWFVLGLSSISMLWFFQKKMQMGSQEAHPTNVDGMIGKQVEVIEELKEGHCYVKLYGDKWMAVSKTNTFYKVGEKTKILAVDGNKVIVE